MSRAGFFHSLLLEMRKNGVENVAVVGGKCRLNKLHW